MMHFSYILSYTSIAAATTIGITNYRRLSRAMKTIALVMVLTCVNELCSYIAGRYKMYSLRYTFYHFYDIILSVLITLYFIFVLRPGVSRSAIIPVLVFWPVLGVLNFMFLQPLGSLNTNIIILESFSFVTLSLYCIYRTLKYDVAENIFLYPHFWISIAWLILWSTSLFFWALLKILYKGHWKYMQTAVHGEAIINAIVYSGIGAIIYFSTRQMKHNER